MQGIFINGSRPKFKKDVKAYVEGINLWNEHGGDPGAIKTLKSTAQEDPSLVTPQDPYGLVVEATSVFGNEFDGSLAEAERQIRNGKEGFVPSLPADVRFYIVGPDPRTSRKWYLTIKYNTANHEWGVE